MLRRATPVSRSRRGVVGALPGLVAVALVRPVGASTERLDAAIRAFAGEAPIGAGRVLGDLVDSGAVPVTELTTLYRQAEGGAIARLATAVRRCSCYCAPMSATAACEANTIPTSSDSRSKACGVPA